MALAPFVVQIKFNVVGAEPYLQHLLWAWHFSCISADLKLWDETWRATCIPLRNPKSAFQFTSVLLFEKCLQRANECKQHLSPAGSSGGLKVWVSAGVQTAASSSMSRQSPLVSTLPREIVTERRSSWPAAPWRGGGSCFQGGTSGSAQREPPGVDVHLGEAQVLQRHGESEGRLHGDVAQQVQLLPALLQLVGGVVQHLLVAVAHLLHFQPVDLPAQADQLAGQTVVLHLHLPLWGGERAKGTCMSADGVYLLIKGCKTLACGGCKSGQTIVSHTRLFRLWAHHPGI